MSEKALVPVRVAGVPEHFNLPWQLALERRAFARAGLDVKWSTVPQGTGAMCDMLEAGTVDVALLVTEGAVRYLLAGGAAHIVSAYVDSPLTWGVHVGPGRSVHDPNTLKSARFAISRPNSGSQLAALAFAKLGGWSIKKDAWVVVNDLKGAVECLKAPGPIAFLWEKYTTKPLVDAGQLQRVAEFRTSWPAFVMVVSDTFLAEHSVQVDRLLKVVRDQAKGLMEKKSAPEMVAQRYGLALSDAKEWFSGTEWNTGKPISASDLAPVVQGLVASGVDLGEGPFEERTSAMVRPVGRP